MNTEYLLTRLNGLVADMKRLQGYACKNQDTDIPGKMASKMYKDEIFKDIQKEINDVEIVRAHLLGGKFGSARLAIDQEIKGDWSLMVNAQQGKYADHPMPRDPVPFFRNNMDYDEKASWNNILDLFREKKIKTVVDAMKFKKWKPEKVKEKKKRAVNRDNYIIAGDDCVNFDTLLPTEAYTPGAKDYWEELKKLEGETDAVRDYLNYIGGEK